MMRATRDQIRKTVRKMSVSLRDIMVGVTFSEAGMFDVAREYLVVRKPSPAPVRLTFDLPGVRIWYGVATAG